MITKGQLNGISQRDSKPLHEKEQDQKKKMPRNEEGFRTKQTCAWVPRADYQKERERETRRRVPINNNIKEKEKNGMYA